MTMSTDEIWAVVHVERARLIEDLSGLDGTDWDMPSLCPGWTVHDVLAHLVDTAETGKIAFIRSMIASRGDFDRANDDGIRRCKEDDPRGTLGRFRSVQDLRRNPPAKRATRLVEAIVHGEDIRRPLGIHGDYPTTGIHEALPYQLRTPTSIGGSREKAAGVRLVDTESNASWGDGDEVRGSAIDLLLAAAGRRIGEGALIGPGAASFVAQSNEG